MEEKEYYFTIKLDFGQGVSATSEEEAKEQVKDTFKEEYNIELEDDEIELNFVHP